MRALKRCSRLLKWAIVLFFWLYSPCPNAICLSCPVLSCLVKQQIEPRGMDYILKDKHAFDGAKGRIEGISRNHLSQMAVRIKKNIPISTKWYDEQNGQAQID